MLKVLCANRLIEPSREWRVQREWFGRSAMRDLPGCGGEVSAEDTRYRCLDKASASLRRSAPVHEGATETVCSKI